MTDNHKKLIVTKIRRPVETSPKQNVIKYRVITILSFIIIAQARSGITAVPLLNKISSPAFRAIYKRH